MKMFIAVLSILALLMVPVAISVAEDAPRVHQAVWYLSDSDMNAIGNWTIKHGDVNPFLVIFQGIFMAEAKTPEGDILTFVYFLRTGRALLILENEGICYYEKVGDGDLEVDAVALHRGDTYIGLYRFGSDVPSIYSSQFLKLMHRFYYDHVYQPEVIDGP